MGKRSVISIYGVGLDGLTFGAHAWYYGAAGRTLVDSSMNEENEGRETESLCLEY